MKKLQSLTNKIPVLVSIIFLASCSTIEADKHAQFEPCSVASNAKEMKSTEFYDAFYECRDQATKGNAVSQKNLAYMYYLGTPNLPPDRERGLYWLKVAADNGSTTDEYRIALMDQWSKLKSGGQTQAGHGIANFHYWR